MFCCHTWSCIDSHMALNVNLLKCKVFVNETLRKLVIDIILIIMMIKKIINNHIVIYGG